VTAQASTGLVDVVAVNVTVMLVELSAAYVPVRLYGTVAPGMAGSAMLTLVIVPLNIVKTWFQRPSLRLGVCGGRFKPVCVSGGMAKVEGDPQPPTPEHGSPATVRLYDVM